MAWTAPKTFSAGSVLTAAELNTHLRDNLNETCAATVTTAGDLAYADAANSMGSRLAIGAAHGMLVSTGSAPVWRIPDGDARTDSATSGPGATSYIKLSNGDWYGDSDVEVTVTTGTLAIVMFGMHMKTSSGGGVVSLSYEVSGATTTAASDQRSVSYESSNASDAAQFSGFDLATLTAGSNTSTLNAKVNTGTGTITYPRIAVLPL